MASVPTLPPEPALLSTTNCWPVNSESWWQTMRDGLSVEVMRPGADASKRWPTVLILTPYVRRFELKPGTTDVEPSPNSYRYRDMFVPRGYAVVVVDARGTGASFGTRDSFRSPRERG